MPDWARRPPQSLPLRPRRVRGGVKPASTLLFDPSKALPQEPALPTHWLAHRILRLVEQSAGGDESREGLQYAELGQTKRIAFEPGRIGAAVQGRQTRPYNVTLTLKTISEDDWGRLVQTMADQALHSARLLAGELPASVEEAFAPLGLRLVPTEPAELTPACSCGHSAPWCKHACCIAILFADALATDPFIIFQLRGLEREDLIERIRQRRAAASAVAGSAPVYQQRAPEVELPPLEECAGNFYEAGPELAELELPLEPPPVSHPLLRRLGPSPFPQASFPLVGLLATCYEVISQEAMKLEAAEPAAEPWKNPEAGRDGS